MQYARPFSMDTTRAILEPGGKVTAKQVTPAFYEELDKEFDNFTGHSLVSTFEFDADWPTWEIHPNGDEIVYLLSGDTDVVLWAPDAETTIRMDTPGTYVVVPRATWHTARPRKPTTMLFITPGEGTINAESPG